MKLVSFQSMEAFKELIDKGYLEADERYIDINKMGSTYEWVVEKMNEYVPNEYKAKFPLWCWVRFKKGICPPKHKGEPVKGFDVKITFEKAKEDIFVRARPCFGYGVFRVPKNGMPKTNKPPAMRVVGIALAYSRKPPVIQ